MTERVLIAGIGNVLRSDDGFGPAVIQALESRGALPPGVWTLEVGIGGIGLVHELMSRWDTLILVDAVDRKAAPGTLFVLAPEVPEIASTEQRIRAADLHEIVPERVLVLAAALGMLPTRIYIVGCQPEETELFSTDLSPIVRAALPSALDAIDALLNSSR